MKKTYNRNEKTIWNEAVKATLKDLKGYDREIPLMDGSWDDILKEISSRQLYKINK